MKMINGQELKKQLDAREDLVVLEALPEEYCQSGHIPGAAHLPLENIDRRAPLVIVFLASSDADWITGETFVIAGGSANIE
jgi:3-mercaptopyruvate sulfurtransferase SseA